MRRIFIPTAVVALALAASAAETRQLGKIDSAKELMGRAVHNTQGKIGETRDFVVDLESGRVLYAVVSVNDNLVGVPTPAFSSSAESKLMIQADAQKLAQAPKFDAKADKIADLDFAKQVHQHFGRSLGWEGTFNNVHKASELIGMDVQNVSNQQIGDVENLGLDLQWGRVTYVILGAGGLLGAGEELYALPPNAFTLASNNKSLVSNLDKERLSNAPQVKNNNWRQLSEPAFAARVYQHYDKQPYWNAQLAPTGRDEGSPRQRISRDRDDSQDRDRDDDRGLRARRSAPNPNARIAAAQFANIEEAQRLIGMNVENPRGAQIGKLNDMVVDLESGRVLLALVDQKGRGAAKAVVPSMLALAPGDKSLRFSGNEAKLESAPDFNRNAELGNAQFVSRVYAHFDQPHNWFQSGDKFGNAHLATDVLKMKVQNTQNENVGQVQNLMVDLQKGRVLYVVMGAAQVVGRGDHLFALPPNAFTMGSKDQILVTDVDKAKLEAAPRFNRSNLRELANPAKAAEIYRYYGKQGYWNPGSDLAPTGRERGRSSDDKD